jgi:hypothetical protein
METDKVVMIERQLHRYHMMALVKRRRGRERSRVMVDNTKSIAYL